MKPILLNHPPPQPQATGNGYIMPAIKTTKKKYALISTLSEIDPDGIVHAELANTNVKNQIAYY